MQPTSTPPANLTRSRRRLRGDGHGSELKATKGRRQYLELTLEIQSALSQAGGLVGPAQPPEPQPEGGRDCTKQLSNRANAAGILQLPNDATPPHNRPVVMKVAVKNDPGKAARSTKRRLWRQGLRPMPGFPSRRNSAEACDGCTGHALGESGLRWLHWPSAPTSAGYGHA